MANRKIEILIDVARGAGFGAGLEALRSLTSAVEEFATTAVVDSVKVAAAFEKNRNTLEVYTGSLRRANAELAGIAELARNTRGLKLTDAEEGTVRLRGLGFAAKTARDLVAGISLNKALSGSDEGAVNRVLQNLEQLKAGSPQANRDIRQMILAIPTLSKVINESFGSVDKFQNAVKKNPGEALEKFAEAAAKTKVGNAGLSDSMIKLENEFETAQRLFGEPLLEPVTESVQSLTKYLEVNKESWRSWGNYIADIIAGINAPNENIIPKPPNAPDSKYGLLGYKDEKSLMDAYNSGAIGLPRYTASLFGMGIRDIDQWTRNFGEPDSINSYLSEKQKIGQNRRMISEGSKRLRADGTIDFSEFSGGKTAKEIEADNKALQDKINDDKERARQADLASLKRNSDAATALLKTRYDNEMAMLDSTIRYTDKEELEYISKSAQIKQNFYTSERARITGYYSKLIALTENGSDEQLKAEVDRTKELAKLNGQEIADAYKSKRQILEVEKKIQDERRQNLLQFNSLQITSIQQGNTKQNFEIQRALDRGSVSYEQYFDKQIGLANESLNSLLEINRKSLELELQNKSLTAEEITNIRKKSLLEEERLVQENAENIYRIQREAVERQKDLISTYTSFRSNIISSASDIQGGFADLLFGNRSTGAQSKVAANTLSQTYLAEYKRLSIQLKSLREKAAAEQERLNTIKAGDSPFLQQLLNEANALDVAIESLKRYGVLQRQAQDLFGTFKATPEGVDELQTRILKQKQNAELASLNNQIATQKKLLDPNEVELTAYERNKESLRLVELEQQAEAVKIRQLAETEEAYRKSINGLRDYIQALSDGDKQATAFARNAAIKNILEDQAGLLEENIYLQEKLARSGQDAAARYKNAWLSAQLEIKEANIRANESIIRSNVQLDDAGKFHSEQTKARILEHLAQQKTMSETVADSVINVYDKATGKIDELLDRAGLGKVPILGDIAKGFVKNQFTNLFRNTVDKILPGFSNELEKTGNPMIDKLTESINIQKQIEANTRGNAILPTSPNSMRDILKNVTGIGIGGTAPFNPNQQGGNWLQKIFGGLLGGSQNPVGYPYAMSSHEGGHIGIGEKQGGGVLGGLFGSKGFGMNAGTMGGIGMLATMAGGAIGGRGGGILSSAGMGLQIGSMFGFQGALIGGAIGLGFGLVKSLFGRGGDAEGKLKKAVKSAYGIDVDKSTLQTLKAIGEAKFGKGSVGREGIAEQVIRLPEAVELLQSYADGSGQKGNNALNLSRLGDENYKENYSRSNFSGFGVNGSVGFSPVSNYVSRTPYSFSVPQSNFSVSAQSPVNSQNGNKELMEQNKLIIALLSSIAKSSDSIDGNTGVLTTASPHDIVSIGAKTAGKEIADSYENELYNGGGRRAERINKGQGIY